MTIYLGFLTAVVLVGWYLLGDTASKKAQTACLLAAGVALVAIMTLRYAIGYDYFSYENIFATVKEMPLSAVLSTYKKEPVLYLLCKLVAMAGGSYRVFLLVCNLIMVGSVLWVIYRYSPVWWVSVFLYVTLQFMPHSMNLLRQSLAASILFLGWGFLKEGKFVKYALIVLLASTFHITALLMLPMYFLLRLPYKLPILASYGVATLAAYVAFKPIVSIVTTKLLPQYSDYLGSEIYANANGFSYVVVPFIYAMAVILLSKAVVKRNKSNSILIYTALFTLINYLFITKMFILERFSIYFFMYAMLLLPEVIASLAPEPLPVNFTVEMKLAGKRQRDSQIIAIILILAGSLGYFFFAAHEGFHKTYPYVGIWETQNAVDNQIYFEEHLKN